MEQARIDQRWWHGALALFLCLYATIGLATLNGLHNWGDDFAHYIIQARAVVETEMLSDPAFVYNDQHFDYSPVSAPPGLSVLLAPVYAVFGLDLKWLKVPVFFTLCLSLVAAFFLFRKCAGSTLAFALILLFALNPFVVVFRQSILSEIPFIMFALLACYCNERRRAGTLRSDLFFSAATGVLIFAAYLTRQVGIVLLLAVLLHDFIRLTGRQALFRSLVLTGAFVFPFLAYKALVTGPGYAEEVARPCMSCIVTHAGVYYRASLGLLYGIGYGPSPFRIADFMILSAVFFAMAGLALRLRTVFRAERPGKLRTLRAIAVMDFFVGGYLLLIVLLPVASGPRFLLPVLPFVLLYILTALRALATITFRLQWVWLLPVALVLCGYIGLDALIIRQPISHQRDGATSSESLLLYDFLERRLGDRDLVLVGKPRAIVLFARRRATVWDRTARPNNFLADVKARRITHLVLGKPASGLPTMRWLFTDPVVTNNFTVIYDTSHFRVLEHRGRMSGLGLNFETKDTK